MNLINNHKIIIKFLLVLLILGILAALAIVTDSHWIEVGKILGIFFGVGVVFGFVIIMELLD